MKTLPTLCLALLVVAPAGAAGLAPLARQLSRGAAKAGVATVAVLPFKAVGGGEDLKMTMTEIKVFLDADREAWSLRAHCGGRAS